MSPAGGHSSAVCEGRSPGLGWLFLNRAGIGWATGGRGVVGCVHDDGESVSGL